MIKASELRKMTFELTDSEKKEVESIEKQLIQAQRNNQNRVLYYKALSPRVIEYLRKHEYKVDESIDRDGFLGVISWLDTSAADFYNK